MSEENIALVEGIYAAFKEGDVPGVVGRMSPDIVWNEAENFPYADRNPYLGPEAILTGVFARLGTDWDGFAVTVDEILDAGDTIVALGRYGGSYKATGKAMNPPVYPREEERRGITGTVTLMLTYDANGTVTGVDVVKSSGNRNLDRAAIKAAQKWKVNPGMRGGVRVAGKAKTDVAFVLN